MFFLGKLDFNPVTDSLVGADGKPFKFSAPYGDELPPKAKGFDAGMDLFFFFLRFFFFPFIIISFIHSIFFLF